MPSRIAKGGRDVVPAMFIFHSSKYVHRGAPNGARLGTARVIHFSDFISGAFLAPQHNAAQIGEQLGAWNVATVG